MRLRRSEGNGNNRLAYSGQRPEVMDEDCIGSQGTQWNVVLERKRMTLNDIISLA
jgi:hypothetical protein